MNYLHAKWEHYTTEIKLKIANIVNEMMYLDNEIFIIVLLWRHKM